MDEKEFHLRADAMLGRLLDALEPLDDAGTLEVDCQNGILNLMLPSGQEYIINKHAPSRQLWLSSPISGGLHFSFDASNDVWNLADGRCLDTVLSEELQKIAGIEVHF